MKGSTLIKGFVVFIAAIFVIHQVVSAVYNPVRTESAIYYTASDSINVTGIIIRNENLVKSDKNGVLHFAVTDSGRVAKGGLIADIYDSESSSIALSRISTIKNKIADIEDILSYNDIDAINLDLINSKLEDKIHQLAYAASTPDFSKVEDFSEELLSVINRKQVALGISSDFTAQLDALNNELNSLTASLPASKGSIYAAESGYFVSNTDGYEQTFSGLELESITPKFLTDAKPVDNGENVIGKIVSDYEWYIAAAVSVDESLKFKEGESLTLETSVKTSPRLSVTLKKINTSQETGDAVLLFSCNQMSSELASMRSGPMTVVRARYDGIKVPRKALRVVDSQKGVYILSGMQINFVPIEIVYSTDNYLICKQENENGNFLKIYDRVVVKGKNLYDGKIVS